MILNEKGKPYLLQGPPEKKADYWDLSQIKYINFEAYGKEETPVKRPLEVPKIVPKVPEVPHTPLKVPEIVTPQKVEIRIERPKITVEKAMSSASSEEQILAKIKGLSGAPIVYQEAITKEEYKAYARAIDLSEHMLYCDKAEFNIFFPKTDDVISCDFISAKWTIKSVSKIGSIIQIKVG